MFLHELKDGAAAQINGFVMGLRGKLRNTTEGYVLQVEFGDGLSGCVAMVDSELVQTALLDGTPVEQLKVLKSSAKARYKELMKQAAAKLRMLEGSFLVERMKSGDCEFVIHAVNESSEDYAGALLTRLTPMGLA